jgi:hypothetical protein
MRYQLEQNNNNNSSIINKKQPTKSFGTYSTTNTNNSNTEYQSQQQQQLQQQQYKLYTPSSKYFNKQQDMYQSYDFINNGSRLKSSSYENRPSEATTTNQDYDDLTAMLQKYTNRYFEETYSSTKASTPATSDRRDHLSKGITSTSSYSPSTKTSINNEIEVPIHKQFDSPIYFSTTNNRHNNKYHSNFATSSMQQQQHSNKSGYNAQSQPQSATTTTTTTSSTTIINSPHTTCIKIVCNANNNQSPIGQHQQQTQLLSTTSTSQRINSFYESAYYDPSCFSTSSYNKNNTSMPTNSKLYYEQRLCFREIDDDKIC